jgi:hypothetical protein
LAEADKAMKGYIYISGAFMTVKRSKCHGTGWLDNDPHFWNQPPTWGICRTDRRRCVKRGDYVFFVLPKGAEQPQMVYSYLRVLDKITHIEAYRRPSLMRKRMGPNKNPNGNIIVTADGEYNPWDGSPSHKQRFDDIKKHYVIGDPRKSEFLTIEKIERLAPRFLGLLNSVFDTKGTTVFEVVRRGGRRLDAKQVRRLLRWLRG